MDLLKNYIYTAILMITLGSIFQCSPANQFAIHNKDIFDAPIKTSGFYYHKMKGGTHSLRFLYKNGTVLALGGSKKIQGPIENIAHETIEDWKKSDYQNLKYIWGAIYFHETYFRIYQWQGIGLGSYRVNTNSGLVLNDSTFIVMKINENKLEEPRIYHFHSYSPKPDSTNQFIE